MNSSISVVIPCYNAGRLLERCISSIKNQAINPLEVIVVDDGSTDDTARIASRLGVKVIKHTIHRGVAAARNTGIKAARGDIIYFIDVDCELYSDSFQYLKEDLEDSSIAGVCGQEASANINTSCDMLRILLFRQSWGNRRMINPPFLWGLCMAFRKWVLLKAGGFCDFFRSNGEDVDISLRLRQLGYKLLYDPRIKVHHNKSLDNALTLIKMVYRYIYFGQIAHLRNKINQKRDTTRFLNLLTADIPITKRFTLLQASVPLILVYLLAFYRARMQHKKYRCSLL